MFTASVGGALWDCICSASPADKEVLSMALCSRLLALILPFCPSKAPAFYLQVSLGSASSHRSSAALHCLHPGNILLHKLKFFLYTHLQCFWSDFILLFFFYFHIQNIPVTGKKCIKNQGGVEFSAVSQSLCELFSSNGRKLKASQLPQKKICHPLENFPMCSWLYMMLWED